LWFIEINKLHSIRGMVQLPPSQLQIHSREALADDPDNRLPFKERTLLAGEENLDVIVPQDSSGSFDGRAVILPYPLKIVQGSCSDDGG
jgi:hypothetical protein